MMANNNASLKNCTQIWLCMNPEDPTVDPSDMELCSLTVTYVLLINISKNWEEWYNRSKIRTFKKLTCHILRVVRRLVYEWYKSGI